MAAKKKSPEAERFLLKLAGQIAAQLTGMVGDQIEDIYEAYRSGLAEMLEADPEANLKSCSLRVGLGVTLKPMPDADVMVGSTLAYGVRRKVEHAPARVTFQDELPGMGD